jgi:hypothetical protein
MKRKISFGSHLELLVHGQQAPLLLGLWWGNTSWWGAQGGTKLLTSNLGSKRKEEERTRVPLSLSIQGLFN